MVVEVDTSEAGVDRMLSVWPPKDNNFHPCAFFSHCLSPTERNFDNGDRLPLGERRHWFEGEEYPFIVWTDHKKRKYNDS